jgi:Ser-tRNA(Ala) deacylase AlaX
MSIDNLPRMHTAEHLLSAVMRKFYGAPRNLEFHLGEKKTKCDYQPNRELVEDDFKKIEALVNAEIARDHLVSEEIIQREAASEFDLWKVPPEANTIRIVRIGDFDAQPCAGKHVEHTAQIGRFAIISHEKRDNGLLRIRFKVE